MLNSVISTEKSKFMTLDIKNFYLNTPLTRFKYLLLKIVDLPEDVIDQYKLQDIATPEGIVYIEVRKGMYGLPQAGILAHHLIKKRPAKHGYTQSQYTLGYWKHAWRPIIFTLVVDDFGVKYIGEEHAQHLINVLENDY